MKNVQKRNHTGRRYVFICGLHRSGTSVLGRNIARMENCTGFKDTGVIEDEGQFLQDVYPTAMTYGGAGRFGFDSRAHLTETSVLFTPANAARLRTSWHAYWDNSKTIFVEKTPGNLLKTRFLQAVFPDSYFIVIRRHPVAVSMANQRWKVSLAPLHSLFDHWLHCHALFDEDKKYLKHVYELSYEDYVRDSDKYHEEIAAFVGTRVPENGMEKASPIYNQKYLDRWHKLPAESPFRVYYRYLVRTYESRFSQYGYSLISGLPNGDEVLREAGMSANVLGVLSCVAADTGALMWRSALRCGVALRRAAKAILPQLVIGKLRQLRTTEI
jgi:hypothetical protein